MIVVVMEIIMMMVLMMMIVDDVDNDDCDNYDVGGDNNKAGDVGVDNVEDDDDKKS